MLKGNMHVKANTELWCCLVLNIYWLISKDSRWATHQSCMVWRLFFHLFLHYCLRSCFSSGRRAGRRMRKGGQKECYWHAGQFTYWHSSLVGYNIIKIILRNFLRQLNLFSVFSSLRTSHHHLLSYLLFCCLSLFLAFPNSPSLLQLRLLLTKLQCFNFYFILNVNVDLSELLHNWFFFN